MSEVRIAVLASGDGSNFEALVEATRTGALQAKIAGLITNRKAPALDRAQRLGIPNRCLTPKHYKNREEWDRAMLQTLQEWRVDWVVLAGFLTLIGPSVLRSYVRRMVNVHPALLPKFGGPGMYGLRVHAAVLANGERESGLTIHWVSEEYDQGEVIAQVRAPVLPNDTADSLAERIKSLEHVHYPRVLNDLIHRRGNIG